MLLCGEVAARIVHHPERREFGVLHRAEAVVVEAFGEPLVGHVPRISQARKAVARILRQQRAAARGALFQLLQNGCAVGPELSVREFEHRGQLRAHMGERLVHLHEAADPAVGKPPV